MRNVSNKEREKLSAEIAGLESLDLHQLRIRWKLLYEIEAPPHLSRDWLRRAVAYRIQENALGGLKPATRRLLERHQLAMPTQGYEEIRQLFERRLPGDAALYNEFHALIVRTGKEYCRTRNPRCSECPLHSFLPHATQASL